MPAHASYIADAKAAAAMRESEVSKADLHRLANKVVIANPNSNPNPNPNLHRLATKVVRGRGRGGGS